MAYMIEGGGSKTFAKCMIPPQKKKPHTQNDSFFFFPTAKTWLYNEKEASHRLLTILTDVSITYLVGQVKAGAQVINKHNIWCFLIFFKKKKFHKQMVQVFDSHAGELAPDLFAEFALPYLKRIDAEVKAQLKSANIDPVPMIVFAKGAHYAIGQLVAQTGYEVVGLDWTVSVEFAKEQAKAAGRAVAFQGNLDPCILYATDDEIKKQVRTLLTQTGTSGWIANLGHGMHPDHDPAKVAVYLKAVAETSAELNAASK